MTSEGQTIYGYIPPATFAFSGMAEVLGHFIGALCSAECARFTVYIETHPTKKDNHLSQFLPAYTLAEWAVGRVEESVWLNRETGAKDALQRWAVAMIEFNTLFRDQGIDDPVAYVEDKGLVKKAENGLGWLPDLERIDQILKFNLRDVDISPFVVSVSG